MYFDVYQPRLNQGTALDITLQLCIPTAISIIAMTLRKFHLIAKATTFLQRGSLVM